MILTRFSGGAGNSDPALSLGGTISATAVGGESASYYSTSIPGVAVAGAFGNAVDGGSGTPLVAASLRYYGSAKALYFTPLGVSPGPNTLDDNGLVLTTSGDFNLRYKEGAYDASVTVTVAYGTLTGSNYTAGLAVTLADQALFDSVPKAEAKVGRVEHRGVYIYNGDTVERVIRVYLKQQPRASDSLAIGLDPAAVGATMGTIASDTLAPSGVTFSAPDSFSLGLDVILPASSYKGLWLRRTVPAMAVAGASPDTFSLAYEVVP